MALFLSIAALLVLALLATSKRFYRLRRSRFGAAAIAGGWIATAVGVLLGPAAGGLITPDAVLRATPLLSVGLGWIGMMIGLQARRDVLARLPRSAWRLAGVDAAMSLAGVGAAVALAALALEKPQTGEFAVTLTLLVASAIGWSMETRSLGLSGTPLGEQRALALRASGGLGAIVAVAVFGVAAALLLAPPAGDAEVAQRSVGFRFLALGVACAIGVVLAIVAKFSLRLAGRRRDEMLVVFLGVVALAAGTSADLGVSPLLPSMIAGATLANLRSADSLAESALFGRFILQAEHVVATIFALLAGVLLDPRLFLPGILLVGMLVAARAVIKPAAVALGMSSPREDRASLRLARAAAIRQSPVAVALAVSLVVLSSVDDARRLLTVLVLVGLICDVLAAFAARTRRATTGSEGSAA